MPPSLHPRIRATSKLAIGAMLVLGACEVSHQREVDTIRVVDTLVRADTVTISSAGTVQAPPVPSASHADSADSEVPPGVDDLTYLRSRRLLTPVAGVGGTELPNTFDEARAGGARRHDALDIRAARGTPVLSVDSGRITKLFTSDDGGLTIYAADPSERFVYYYAHLDRYEPRVREGRSVRPGDTIGYVGTTGNAPPNTPHLHFAVMKLRDSKRWWDGVAINPHPLLVGP
jgi:murein DD-endopeptidase MepM/ murein hydrolase activator NlpD